MNKTIYQQLKAIADSNPHLLTGYRTDLTQHDLDELRRSRAGEVYVWGIREYGTHLNPTPDSCNWGNENPTQEDKEKAWKWNHDWIACKVKYYPEALWFKVTVTARNQGTVEPISPEEAISLLAWESKTPLESGIHLAA